MSFANSSPSTNQYIKALEHMQYAESSLPGLVIADSHRQLLQQSRKTLEAGQYAYLAAPQELWAREEEQWSELLRWCIHRLKLKSVVLVGTTEPSLVGHSPKIAKPLHQAAGAITATLRQAQAERIRAQQYFVDRYSVFSDVVRREARDAGVVTLFQGFIYRPESGIFAAYEPETNSFWALLPTQSTRLQI